MRDLTNADKFMESKEIATLEKMLKRQVEAEVSSYIYDMVQPKVDAMIEDLAAQAVKEWSVHLGKGHDAESMETRIMVNFVNNIVKTVAVPNDIKIEVIKEKEND